jgi:hypothetical protein
LNQTAFRLDTPSLTEASTMTRFRRGRRCEIDLTSWSIGTSAMLTFRERST